MSPLYPCIYMIFQLVAGAAAAGHSQRDVMEGIRQRHGTVFGTMDGTSSIFSENPVLSNRYLQETGGIEDGFTESQCSYTFQGDDDFIENTYGANSSATCGCTLRSNYYDILGPLRIALPNETTATQDEIDAYVMEFNSEVENLRSNLTASCNTECSVCFAETNMTPSALCGMMSYSETYRYRGVVSGNTTWEDILSGLNTSNSEKIVTPSSGSSETCINFTSGSTGTLCFGDNVNFDMNQAVTCSVAYNGITCNSCEAVETATDTCLIADCTNASPSTMLDSCNMTGFIGPFAILLSLFDETVDYTLGNCDISSTPPALFDASTSPTPAPVNSTSTVALTPTIPTAPPTMGEAPTAAPFTAVEEAPIAASTLSAAPASPPTAGGLPTASTIAPAVPVPPPLAGAVPATPPTAARAPATPATMMGAAPATSNGCCNPDLFAVSGLLLASSMLLGVA